MRLPPDSEVATARRLVVVAGLAYLTAQLVAFSLDRPPGWDEAIYLSQVTPGAEPLLFIASRARGITFLAAPVLLLGGSLPVLRLFLAVASAAALIAAFRVWVPVIGLGAVAAALLFAGSWPALFYGSELMPNLWVALIAVAATAVLARRLVGDEGRQAELVAGALVAIAALIRPLDAVIVTAALVLLPIAVRRSSISWTVHLLVGLAVGWAPWVVEMSSRLGSPLEAFAAAARQGHAGRWSFVENIRQYVALSDGPSIGPVPDPDIPIFGTLGIIGLGILIVSSVRAAKERGILRSLAVPTFAGLAFVAAYVGFTDAQAPRFLLPALALLTLPAGLGLATIVSGLGERGRRRSSRSVAAACAVLVVAWAVVQMGTATKIEAAVTGQRSSAERVGLRVRTLADGDTCHVYAEGSFPIVGFASGCRAAPLGKVLASWTDRVARLEADGVRVFLALHRTDPLPPPEGTAILAEFPSHGGLRWFLYGSA